MIPFLILCAACSATKPIEAVPVTQYVTPPALLMQATPEPQCNATTNGELLDCYFSARDALRAANADKAAMRAFVTGVVR